MSAAVIDEAAVRDLAQIRKATLDYASGFGVDRTAELHGHDMMTGFGDWAPIRGQARSAIAIYRRALSLLATLPVKAYVDRADVGRLNSRYRYPRPPHVVTLQHVLERVENVARRLGTTATVIADEVPGQAGLIRRAQRYPQAWRVESRACRKCYRCPEAELSRMS